MRRQVARADYRWNGMLYRDLHEMAEDILYDWVTASGANSPEEAMEFLEDGPRVNLKEMRRAWDLDPEVFEYLEDAWRELADAVESDLERLIMSNRRARRQKKCRRCGSRLS